MSDTSEMTIFEVAHRLQVACERMVSKCPNCNGKGKVVILGEDFGPCPECEDARDAVVQSKMWIEDYMNYDRRLFQPKPKIDPQEVAGGLGECNCRVLCSSDCPCKCHAKVQR